MNPKFKTVNAPCGGSKKTALQAGMGLRNRCPGRKSQKITQLTMNTKRSGKSRIRTFVLSGANRCFEGLRMKCALLLLLVILPLLATLPGAKADTLIGAAITRVPFTISKPGAYRLAGNLTMTKSTGSAITITASNVVLDLNGYALTAGTNANVVGVYGVSIGAPNVTVRDGKIIGFGRAVSTSDEISEGAADNPVVEDLTCESQVGLAAILLYSTDAVISRVHITNPTQAVSASLGILAYFSCTITDCSISDLRAPSGTYVAPFDLGGGAGNGVFTDLVEDCIASNLTAVSGSSNSFTILGGAQNTIMDRCHFYNMPGGAEIAGTGHITIKNSDFRSCGSTPLSGVSDGGGNSVEP